MDQSIKQRARLSGPPTSHAALTNMGLALRTMMDCWEAGCHGSRFGVFYGFSGYGKTYASTYVAAKTGAVYVHAKSCWTPKSIARAIAEELGVYRRSANVDDLVQAITTELRRDPRPIIIDEMDHLVQTKKQVELIRDIYDDALEVPFLLIGEEALPAKLKEWERFDNRILVATPAQPASANDALTLRDHYCRGVRIDDDLVEHIRIECAGVTRRIVNNLRQAQEEAKKGGAAEINLAWWGDRPLRTGEYAPRRKGLVS